MLTVDYGRDQRSGRVDVFIPADNGRDAKRRRTFARWCKRAALPAGWEHVPVYDGRTDPPAGYWSDNHAKRSLARLSWDRISIGDADYYTRLVSYEWIPAGFAPIYRRGQSIGWIGTVPVSSLFRCPPSDSLGLQAYDLTLQARRRRIPGKRI